MTEQERFEQAVVAKTSLKSRLGCPSWLHSVRLDRNDGDYVIKVNVYSDTLEIRNLVPIYVGGVAVHVEVSVNDDVEPEDSAVSIVLTCIEQILVDAGPNVTGRFEGPGMDLIVVGAHPATDLYHRFKTGPATITIPYTYFIDEVSTYASLDWAEAAQLWERTMSGVRSRLFSYVNGPDTGLYFTTEARELWKKLALTRGMLSLVDLELRWLKIRGVNTPELEELKEDVVSVLDRTKCHPPSDDSPLLVWLV